jgi:hypothetical protein
MSYQDFVRQVNAELLAINGTDESLKDDVIQNEKKTERPASPFAIPHTLYIYPVFSTWRSASSFAILHTLYFYPVFSTRRPASPSLLFLLNAACLAEKQQIPI